jgi:threonine synthase
MRYISTRGVAPELGFAECVLEGLAEDGGLYVPKQLPAVTNETLVKARGFAGGGRTRASR